MLSEAMDECIEQDSQRGSLKGNNNFQKASPRDISFY
jgi:hypothetical protein